MIFKLVKLVIINNIILIIVSIVLSGQILIKMELILVSGKPGLIGQSCELDLCFHLNRMPNIPRPHTVRPWNRTKMSPFRDRWVPLYSCMMMI